jgi:hypothetical protein
LHGFCAINIAKSGLFHCYLWRPLRWLHEIFGSWVFRYERRSIGFAIWFRGPWAALILEDVKIGLVMALNLMICIIRVPTLAVLAW